MARYWEDYKLGEKYLTPGRTVTETIINVCSGLLGITDYFVWDDVDAKKSVFGSRAAPGVICLALVDSLNAAFLDAETSIALVGLEGRFRSPVRVGDTVRAESEITEKKETKNPERGIIIFKSHLRNQLGVEVIEAEVRTMVKRRGKGASR